MTRDELIDFLFIQYAYVANAGYNTQKLYLPPDHSAEIVNDAWTSQIRLADCPEIPEDTEDVNRYLADLIVSEGNQENREVDGPRIIGL